MLDLVPNNSRLSDIRDGIQYDHVDPFDLSLFTDRAVFERVPIAAEIEEPYYDDTVVHSVGLDNYHAVLNKATGQLVDMRPIPKTYQLVPHQDMMKVQAQQLEDSPLDGRLRVVDRLFEAGKKAHRTIYFEDLCGQMLKAVRVQIVLFLVWTYLTALICLGRFKCSAGLIVTCAAIR